MSEVNNLDQNNNLREKWGSRIGFILATVGWSIGLGNIWRFPYITGKYGGGAFVLVYLVFLVLIAIPTFTTEISLGRESQSSPTTGFKKLAPGKPWSIGGWFGMLGGILIFSYYTMIIGWVVSYFFRTLSGSYSGMGSEQINQMFTTFTSSPGKVIIWQIAVMILLGIIVSRGLVNGVEKFSKIMMPILFFFLVGLSIYSLRLPGALKGLTFYLKPDFSKLTGEAYIAALGQAFLSVGVGQGASWIYGSYLDKKSDIPGDSLIIGSMDTLGALLAGLIIFPTAFAYGVNPDAGFGLIFVTLPNIFANMNGGVFFGTLFFFLVTIAAISSAIAFVEAIASWIMDQFNWDRSKSRVKAVWVAIAGSFLLGLFSVLAMGPLSHIKIFGKDMFSFIDYISANVFLILAGLIMVLYVGWSIGIKKFKKFTNEGAKRIMVQDYWGPWIKFVLPIVIFILFVMSI